MWDWIWQGADEWWRGAWCSVLLPLLVCARGAYRHASCFKSTRFWALTSVCWLASVGTGEWRIDAESASLHMLPVFFISLAFLAYWKRLFEPLVAYAGCFITLFLADVTHAVWAFSTPGADLSYLKGVGGAGLQDGLFMFPLLSALLMLYARRRHLNKC